MAYQPIEMPGPQGFDIAGAFQQARAEQRQRQQDAWSQMIQSGEADRAQQRIDLERQQEADRRARQQIADQQAEQDRRAKLAEHIQQLHEAGLSHEAQQLAGIYGLVGQETPQTSGPRVGRLYDNNDLSQFAQHALAGDQQQPVDAVSGGAAPVAEAGPIEQAAQRYHEAPGYTYTGPGGFSFTVDPRERELAQLSQNERLAARFKAAFQAEPGMAPYAGEFAARAELGEPSGNIFADLRARQQADAKAREKAAGEQPHSAARFEQEKELARIRAAAAANMQGARLNQTEAHDIGEELKAALVPVTDKKEGIAARQRHLGESINQVQAQPHNPVAWTNFIDGMIRTNTGRAAIKAQYDLYTQHAGGAAERFENWFESLKSGNPGEGIRNNLLGAGQAALGELAREGGEEKSKIRAYETDPRVVNNPVARAKVKAMEHTAFGNLADHPAGDEVGTVRTLPNGKKVKKVGDNQWEAVP
jgi:hypothetical protein